MPELKERLRADLTTAMKARDELRSATLRMALTAVKTEEVSGKSARELSDDEVRLQAGQRPDPLTLALLPRSQMQVRDVQDAQRPRARLEHRHLDPAKPVGVDLVARRVTEARDAGGEHGERDGRGSAHAPC